MGKAVMFVRRRAGLKYVVAAGVISVVLYMEMIVYHTQPFFWPTLQCPEEDGSCAKVLFVADPQIQGDLVVPFPLNSLFSWDSDRYLKSTFSVVMKHFRPDVIVYLGDLMDEGSISTKVQFHAYAKRLMNIFDIDYPVVQVWLPGDNDIGGENEPVRINKVQEFNRVFGKRDIITYKDIAFLKVSGITHTTPTIPDLNIYGLRIVVSHFPVSPQHFFGRRVYENLYPHIYFCAHQHKSKYLTFSRKDLLRMEQHDLYNQILTVNTSEEALTLYEVYVPTCSYRMGTASIGFGAAVIENDHQQLRYAVFWSPTRFPYIIVYILIALNVMLWLVVVPLFKRISSLLANTSSRRHRPLRTNSED